nr:ribonuclease-like [Pelodiscus sinensis]|eukprot:XP_014435815.1 ribonuclease-like [Pelodiscus sinensis]
MAPQGSRLALLSLLCLPRSTANTPYDKFLKQHVDFPKSWAENELPRGLPQVVGGERAALLHHHDRSSSCQPRNTFLHASEAQLRAVCRSGASQGPDVRDSQGTFRLTVCTRRPKGPCLYQGSSTTARIRLACRDGSPVQYLRRL